MQNCSGQSRVLITVAYQSSDDYSCVLARAGWSVCAVLTGLCKPQLGQSIS